MQRTIFLLIVMLGLSAAAFGQKMTDAQIIEKNERDSLAAVVRGDLAELDKYFDESFTITDPLGNVQTKAQMFASFKSGEAKLES